MPYRSTDWQVVESEIIVLGEVTAVAPFGDRVPERLVDPEGVAATVEVKIEKTLKGRPPDGPLRIRNGPIESCYEGHVFATLSKGERAVFMLPAPRVGGVYSLRWGGCLPRAEEAPEIEERIARAMRFRDDCLAGLRRNRPETVARAEQLHGELFKLSAHWPREGQWGADVVQEALAAIRGYSIDEISTATVLDLSVGLVRTWSGAQGWTRHVLGGIQREREKELMAYDAAVVRDRLIAMGITEAEIKAYLESPVDRPGARFGHPFPSPSFPRRELGASTTVDFLLHAQAYDRGMLWARYAMGVDLSGLDGKRAEAALRKLWASGDEDARHLVSMALPSACGTGLSGWLLDLLLSGDIDARWCWRPTGDKDILERQLVPLLDAARERGELRVWSLLAKGECFNATSMKLAVERLEAIEAQGGGLTGSEAEAVCGFLNEALGRFRGPIPSPPSAEGYRQGYEAVLREGTR